MAVKLSRDEGLDIEEMADINVTPFIDVMLVLLIIFMVAAPLSTVDVPVDLPVSNAAVQPRPAAPIYLTIRRDLSVSLGEETVPRALLQERLDAASGGDRDRRVFLRADQGIAYGDLMVVMNQLRRSGYLKIALVGLEDTGQATGRPSP